MGNPDEVNAEVRNSTFNVFSSVMGNAGGGSMSEGSNRAVVGGLSSLLSAPTQAAGEDTQVAAQARGMVRHKPYYLEIVILLVLTPPPPFPKKWENCQKQGKLGEFLRIP